MILQLDGSKSGWLNISGTTFSVVRAGDIRKIIYMLFPLKKPSTRFIRDFNDTYFQCWPFEDTKNSTEQNKKHIKQKRPLVHYKYMYTTMYTTSLQHVYYKFTTCTLQVQEMYTTSKP